jgi:hypothetical protein
MDTYHTNVHVIYSFDKLRRLSRTITCYSSFESHFNVEIIHVLHRLSHRCLVDNKLHYIVK